jgi:hypothetical protein
MEGFSFVTTVTGLSRPNTGKEDDYDDNYQKSPTQLHYLDEFILFCVMLDGITAWD